MRSGIILLLLGTSALVFQEALAGSSQSRSSAKSSAKSSSSSGSSSSGSSSSSSSGSSSSSSSGSSSSSSSGSSSSSSSGSSSSSSSKKDKSKPKKVGIKCIGYEDTHMHSKDFNADSKYPPFNQDCPKDSSCATFYLNAVEGGEYAKIRYSGCPTTTFKNKPINLCDEGSNSIAVTINGGTVKASVDCCSSDYCNQQSSHASLSVRNANAKSLSSKKVEVKDDACAKSTDEFDLNEKVKGATVPGIAIITLSTLSAIFYVL